MLTEPRRPEDLARVIGELMTTPRLSEKLVREARTRVLARFTWETYARNMLRVFEQGTERLVAVVGFVERRLEALHRVFNHRRPQTFFVFAAEGRQGFDQEREGLALHLGRLGVEVGDLGVHPFEVLVVDELVAVVAQQVGRGLDHAQADDVLAEFLQLGYQRREVGVFNAVLAR